jgi:DUF2075 family protein
VGRQAVALISLALVQLQPLVTFKNARYRMAAIAVVASKEKQERNAAYHAYADKTDNREVDTQTVQTEWTPTEPTNKNRWRRKSDDGRLFTRAVRKRP